MSKPVLRWLVFLFATLLPCSMAAASTLDYMGEPKVEYSADAYVEMDDVRTTMKVYRAPGKERAEVSDNIVIIKRNDLKLMWNVNSADKTYTEIKDSEEELGGGEEGGDFKKTKVGVETIEGMKTTKSRITFTEDGKKEELYVWETKDGIVMKGETLADMDGRKAVTTFGLRNLKVGKVSPKLFEPPAGYKKVKAVDFGAIMRQQQEEMRLQEKMAREAEEERRLEAEERKRERASRSYTSQERSYTAAERSYTAAPRGKGGPGSDAAETAKDTAKKLWKLFGK